MAYISSVSNSLTRLITERKVIATQGSIKLPSPAPSLYVSSSGRGRRKKRGVSSEVDDMDFDFGEETQAVEEGEGEEGEGEEGDDGDDKELYCFCQKLSYGEMIACDNPDCPYQWVSNFTDCCAPIIITSRATRADHVCIVPPSLREPEATTSRTLVLCRMYQARYGRTCDHRRCP